MDKKKRSIGIGVAITMVVVTSGLFVAGYAGFIPNWGRSGETIQVTDMFGRTINVTRDPDRVVGTGAGALRYLVYLDAVDKVCGVENVERDEEVDPRTELRPYNLAHPAIRALPSIGPIWGGEAELIVAAGPEVVFTTNYQQAGDLDALQTQLGIPVVGLIYGDLGASIDTLWTGLNLTARVLGKTARFAALKTYVESVLDDLATRASQVPAGARPTCYVGGVGYRGTHGISSTKPRYDPFALVNATNVATALGGGHQFVDPEQVITWDPQKIFIDGGGYALMMDDLASGVYDSMQAVQAGEIYILLPYNWYTANLETILVDAYFVGKTLFPEQFSGVNLNTTAAEIYTNFVGSDVFAPMMRNFENSAGTTQDALARVGGTFAG